MNTSNSSSVESGYRVSPQQARLWALGQTRTSEFRTQAMVTVEGPLELERLRNALFELGRGYEILHTQFVTIPGVKMPLQAIGNPVCPSLDEIDLSEMDEARREESVARAWSEALQQPFDGQESSPLKVRILRYSNHLAKLIFNQPAIYSDTRALEILIECTFDLYSGKAQPSGEDGPLQNVDYSEWLHQILESENSGAGREFWRTRHQERFGPFTLSANRATRSAMTFRLASVKRTISTKTFDSFLAACALSSVSTAAFLAACWSIVLSRRAGASEITIGYTYDGRRHEELDRVVGLLEQCAPIYVDVRHDSRFNDLVTEVAASIADGREWQEYSLSSDVADQQGRGYQFACHQPLEVLSKGGLTWTIGQQHSCSDRFELKLDCFQTPSRLTVQLLFDSNLFGASEIELLGEQFEILLNNAAKNPHALLGALEIHSDDSLREIFTRVNSTGVPVEPKRTTLPELLQEASDKHGERVAVVSEGVELRYAEVDRRSNQLSQYLRKRGIRPEARVGICLARSSEMVIAMIAVLKAGGAYVPLDPGYPAERLAFMAEDAQLECILSETGLASSLAPAGVAAKVVFLDQVLQDIGKESESSLGCEVQAQNLAYIIYTSGSTGKPKGVQISHGAICNRLLWMQSAFPIGESDAVLQKTVFGFDASVWEIFLPLISGARLVLTRPGGEKDSGYLTASIQANQITVLQLVPSMLRVLVEDPDLTNCKTLRRVFCGGEALPASAVERFWERLECELVNLYGPTEATIDATFNRCLPGETRTYAPIGKPIQNMQVHVLNGDLESAAFGVPGELYLAGAGLARGYQHRPDLTAERFVPNPFGGQGTRLYKTGDIARFLLDGNLEFLGRSDDQVKLRGYRIELGEIESLLRKHPAVQDAVVVLKEEDSGDQRLVSYVVPASDDKLKRDEFHRLPNGLDVAHLHTADTNVVYKEIFEENAYLRHGIVLSDDCCVLDVGANIGMFSLYVLDNYKNARVFAFEPIPPIFRKLQTNLGLYSEKSKAFACGLGSKQGEETFTFYPRLTTASSRYADPVADEALSRAFIANQDAGLASFSDELLEGRFQGENFQCQLKTVSELLRENEIFNVDLLKIDVEKSEAEVLEGIAPQDWAKIDQIAMEVHDLEGKLLSIKRLLEDRGYRVTVDQDAVLANTELYNLYATRCSPVQSAPGSRSRQLLARHKLELSDASLREYLKASLPEYMIPAVFVKLRQLPLQPNQKLDRRRLPEPDQSSPQTESATPRNAEEEILCGLMAELLKRSHIGIDQNFFDLGGHSLLATQLVSRIRATFAVEFPLRALFEAPTAAGMAAQVRASRDRHAASLTLIPPTRPKALPLSYAQQRLWFIDQMEPGATTYNIPFGLRLRGRLNREALIESLQNIVRRHEILRTSFAAQDGIPVQRIHQETSLSLDETDLRGLTTEEQQIALKQAATEYAALSFDLSKIPLLRLKLLCLEEQEHVLLAVMHHIISDGWSTAVLMKEFVQLYSASVHGTEPDLPELKIQYADFALWQREWLQGSVLQEQLDYWKDVLAGAVQTELPTTYVRPPVMSHRGEHLRFAIPSEVAKRTKALARREGATLYMTSLAAFHALFQRYTGQSDIVVGATIAGRTMIETEPLIGMFFNTVPIRVDLPPDPRFRELLGRVRERTLGAYAHQHLPFERLIAELGSERDLSHNPLFQTIFELQSTQDQSATLPGLIAEWFDLPNKTAKVDLILTMFDQEGDHLAGNLEFSTDLFDRATAERMIGHYQTLLGGIVANPAALVSELPLLTESEYREIVGSWNATAQERDRLSMHQLLSLQAKQTPGATALLYEDQRLSFAELERRANQLAHHLRKLGVGPETTVGLCVDRGFDMVIGLFGIMKAGGAYVPLDPTYPGERLSYVLSDCQAPVLVTQSWQLPRLKHSALTVCLDREGELLATLPEAEPESEVTDENLACVYYTSGSTGRPKGVALPHSAIVNYLTWGIEAYGAVRGNGAAVHTSIAVDLTLTSFLPLFVGQPITLVPESSGRLRVESHRQENCARALH